MIEFDISGLTEYLDEISAAMKAVDGNLGQVKIDNVDDPAEVKRALSELNAIVDKAFSAHVSNPTVVAIAEQMKGSYRAQMLQLLKRKQETRSEGQGLTGRRNYAGRALQEKTLRQA